MDPVTAGVMLGGFAQFIWKTVGQDVAVGIAGNEAHARLKAVLAGRFRASRGLPQNHDIAKALRRAQLEAMRYIVQRWKETERANPHVAFAEGAAIGFREALASADHLVWDSPLENAVYASFDRCFTRTTDPNLAVIRVATDAAWQELLSWSEGSAVPERLRARFFGESSTASWWDAFTAKITETLKENERFRAAYLADRLVSTGDLVVEARDVWTRMDASQRELRADMTLVRDRLEGKIDITIDHTREILELVRQLRNGVGTSGLAEVQRAGLNEAQIDAVLREFALEGLKPEAAFEALLSAARDLIKLRAQIAAIPGDDETAPTLADARRAIDEGRLNDARHLLLQAKDQHRALAERLIDSGRRHRLREASLQADVGDLDAATLRFADAAQSYAEAASIAATVSPADALRFRYRQADALRRQGDRSPELTSFTAWLDVIRDHIIPLTRTLGTAEDTAAAEVHLGNALLSIGDRSGGSEGRILLKEAAEVLDGAFGRLSEGSYAWASAQVARGSVFVSLAGLETGETAKTALDQALPSYRLASEVFETLDASAWARAQSGLSTVYEKRAWLQPSDAALADSEAAIQHIELALSVVEPASDQWAELQSRAMHVVRDLAGRQEIAEGQANYLRAMEYGNAALTVFLPDTHPVQYAATLDGLGTCDLRFALLYPPTESLPALEEAVMLHRASLKVMTRGGTPRFWATCQTNYGVAAFHYGQRRGGDGADILLEGIESLEQASGYFTKALYPDQFAFNRQMLAYSLRALADISGDRETYIQALAAAADSLALYRERDHIVYADALATLSGQIELAISAG